jgi:dTDP-4-amino-4,6-dideoxygalactose transaminase
MEKAYEEILTLPLHFGLTDDDFSRVIRGVIEGLTQ